MTNGRGGLEWSDQRVRGTENKTRDQRLLECRGESEKDLLSVCTGSSEEV